MGYGVIGSDFTQFASTGGFPPPDLNAVPFALFFVFVQTTSGFGSLGIGNGVSTTILFSSILLQEARSPESSEVVAQLEV